MCCALGIGLFNGFILLPVLLSMFGPPAEIVPYDHVDRISTPSPSPSPQIQRKPRNLSRASYFGRRRIHSEISLSTISEEPQSYHSSREIVVQPELVLETTTVTTGPQFIYPHTTSATTFNNEVSLLN